MGSPFSMSAPITKVVKNDAYTAPRVPVPVAPTRPRPNPNPNPNPGPSPSPAAFRSSSSALKPVSRTLQQAPAAPSPPPAAPPQVRISVGIHLVRMALVQHSGLASALTYALSG